MGQSKSKSWRRLSESDCLHLLNDDELNNHNQNNLYPPTTFQSQDFKYHTITNAKKWGANNNGPNNTSANTGNKCTNITNEDIFTRNRSGSACVMPSSDATLLKFSKFDNGEFAPPPAAGNNMMKKNYNTNLYEAGKNGSMVRKSLPPCPNPGKILTPVPAGMRHPPPGARFFPSMLEPELLLRPNKNLNIDADNSTSNAFRQSDLIESPPPLPDSAMPFGKPPNARPITMYQFEPFGTKPGVGAFSTRRSSVLGRGLSLSDLLEQCNTFDECCEEECCEEFSDQTLVDHTGGSMPPNDTSDHPEENKDNGNHENNNNCLLVDISSPDDHAGQGGLRELVPRMPPPNSGAIRCSGLDCICDRCIQHRFKLLNWLLPNCTRINAERLLHGRMEGTFLVRKSEKFPGQYTLSFVCRRTVRHCLIMRSVYGFGLRWPYSFETLQQVIIHYARTTLAEFNSKLDVRLRYPVFMT